MTFADPSDRPMRIKIVVQTLEGEELMYEMVPGLVRWGDSVNLNFTLSGTLS